MAETKSTSTTASEIRAKVGHPIVDGDAHVLESALTLLDYIKQVGGPGIARRYETMDSPWKYHDVKSIFWGMPSGPNSLDRATAMLPKLFRERLDEGGIDVFTSLITATVVDSTENPVPQNTLVQFQSLTENENGELAYDIGSIDQWSYTGVDEEGDANGQASAIFNMGNDVGLAQIIGNAPQFNLADTIYVSLYSTSASSLEIVPPSQNEITVQGGGGIESTEINVNVKDGNGNLVSEPFLVKFEIQSNAPNGVYLNELDDDSFVECVESSNGIATVTLNSGSQPGSVPLRVELYDIDDLTDNNIYNQNNI